MLWIKRGPRHEGTCHRYREFMSSATATTAVYARMTGELWPDIVWSLFIHLYSHYTICNVLFTLCNSIHCFSLMHTPFHLDLSIHAYMYLNDACCTDRSIYIHMFLIQMSCVIANVGMGSGPIPKCLTASRLFLAPRIRIVTTCWHTKGELVQSRRFVTGV